MKPKYLIIHHTATDRDTTTFEAVDKHHKSLGWGGIGYHKFITAGGWLHEGRREDAVGAHCKDGEMNFKSLGICLTGNFQTEHPAADQLNTLQKIVRELQEKYQIPNENILGHREVPSATACPGRNLLAFVAELRRGVEETEMNRHFIREHSLGILGKEPTDNDFQRWEKEEEPVAIFITEAVSERKKVVKNELADLKEQAAKLETTIGEYHQSTGSKLGLLADSVGQITSQLETERKILADTSSKTEKIQETTVELIKEDIEAEKRFGGLRERMNGLETKLKELLKGKGVSESEIPNTETAEVKEIHRILSRLISFVRGIFRGGA